MTELIKSLETLKPAIQQNLPPVGTPVLCRVAGIPYPIVLEIRVSVCDQMNEPFYGDYPYWDDPENDGQDYGDRVIEWTSLEPISEMEWVSVKGERDD